MRLRTGREELSSETFKKLYQELQEKHEMLSTFPTVFDLIEFFHSDSREYAVKDSILGFLGASIKRGSLREISGDPRAYQKMKKRRQRAIAAMKLYLQRRRRLRALEECLSEDEISLAEIVRDLLE